MPIEAKVYTQEKLGFKPRGDILESLIQDKKEAPQITQRSLLSIPEIASVLNTEPDKIKDVISLRMSSFTKELENACSYPEEEYVDLVEQIYTLFKHSSDDNERVKYPWLKDFSTLDNFVAKFCPEISVNGKAYLGRNIERFLEIVAHPSHALEMRDRGYYPFKNVDQIYEDNGKWILLPDALGDLNRYGSYEFATEGVVKEIVDLLMAGYKDPDYSHATGSSALAGIAKHGAILSGRESIRREEKISTGEIYWYKGLDTTKKLDEYRGLASVYVDRGGPSYGYNYINWFDEFHINFGINKARQDDFIRSTDFRYTSIGAESGGLSADYGSEGVVVGHMVPMSSVDVVYCWKKYIDQTKKWAEKNCPHAKVISLEAAQTLHSHGKIVNQISFQEDISPAEAWKKLLEI